MVTAIIHDSSIHVGFTGTQDGMNELQIFRCTHLMDWLRKKGYEVLHHGDCIGADAQADYLWHSLDGKTCIHPPIVAAKCAFCALQNGDTICIPEEYLSRNKWIVDQTSRLIVTPKTTTEVMRSGTWSTFRYAMQPKLKRPIHLIWPNGTVENYNV